MFSFLCVICGNRSLIFLYTPTLVSSIQGCRVIRKQVQSIHDKLPVCQAFFTSSLHQKLIFIRTYWINYLHYTNPGLWTCLNWTDYEWKCHLILFCGSIVLQQKSVKTVLSQQNYYWFQFIFLTTVTHLLVAQHNY